MLRPREACYIDFWSGWLQVTHSILYSDESKVDVDPMEKHFLWMYPGQASGLWFPPGRVLVCDDKLDLAIHLNESELVDSFLPLEEENAAALGRSQDNLKQHGSSARFVFAKAARDLAGSVDTIVFKSHAEVSPRGPTRRLLTEYILMPSSHVYRPLGCPVSSAFRIDANYAPARWKPGAEIRMLKTSPDNGVFDALLLAPCNCSASTSPVC
jgi:hypothetical protein